jgi:hypothetical protein
MTEAVRAHCRPRSLFKKTIRNDLNLRYKCWSAYVARLSGQARPEKYFREFSRWSDLWIRTHKTVFGMNPLRDHAPASFAPIDSHP